MNAALRVLGNFRVKHLVILVLGFFLARPVLADVYDLRCDKNADDKKLRNELVKAMNIGSFAEGQRKLDHLMNRLGRGTHADGVLNPISLRAKFEAKGGGGVKAFALYLADRICLEVNYPHVGYESHTRAFFENHWRTAVMTREQIVAHDRVLADDVAKAKTEEDKRIARSARTAFRSQVEDGLKAQILIPAIVTTNIGFREKLNEFWFNHFNIYSRKTNVQSAPYYRKLRHYQGSMFRDLLISNAQDPAMLIYLDLHTSIRDPKGGDGGLNENYAREVMELHTLGVGPSSGVYDQADVTAAARILTGWGLTTVNGVRTFQFKGALHDRQGADKKTVMKAKHYVPYDKKNPEVQIAEGYSFFTQLAQHHRTKGNICRKLIRRFVGENLNKPLSGESGVYKDCVQAWGTNGNLRAVYGAIVTSKDMWDMNNYQKDIKNPLSMSISFLRLMGVQASNLVPATVNENCAKIEKTRIACHPIVAAVHNVNSLLGIPTGLTAPPIGYSERGADYANASMTIETLKFTYAQSQVRNTLYNPFNSQRIGAAAFEALTTSRLLLPGAKPAADLNLLVNSSLRLYPLDWQSRIGAAPLLEAVRNEPYMTKERQPQPFRTLATRVGGSRLFLYE